MSANLKISAALVAVFALALAVFGIVRAQGGEEGVVSVAGIGGGHGNREFEICPCFGDRQRSRISSRCPSVSADAQHPVALLPPGKIERL